MNERKLKDLLQYINESIPNYLRMLDQNLTPGELLQTLPIISKGDIRQNYKKYIDKSFYYSDLSKIFDHNKTSMIDYIYEIDGKKIFLEYTSGSTGEPFFSLKSPNDRIRLSKNLWSLRQKIDRITPSKLFRFMHLGAEKINPFPFEWTEEEDSINKQLEYLSQTDYTWWHTYPSIIRKYLNFMLKYPMDFPNLRIIESNGAYISDKEIREIEEAFRCKVINNYGCREVWTIAYGCSCGYLHINEDNVVVELLGEDNQIITKANQPGQVVLTSLNQKCMPMIRYNLGDWAYYLDGPCECGSSILRMVVLPGRNVIKGTKNLYGNQHFSNVIKCLIQNHGISDFNAINVVQSKENLFEVYITDFHGDKLDLEKCFIQASNEGLGMYDRYQYRFFYHEKQLKSLFQCICG